MCFIVQNIGDQLTPEEYKDNYLEFWGWNENKEEAIKKYAHAICDSIDKYGYDGFDIDYEPNFGHRGNMSGSDENMLLFIQTLGERIGPKSGTDRLLVIDGEPQSIVSESVTTGEATADGRKKLTRADIVALKKKFDKLKIPKEGRILVLCADHVADLLETDQRFEKQVYDYTTGKIAKMYGFDVYEYDECPYYDTTTLKKKAYGAVVGESDRQSSVAFTTKRAMRADGSTKSYLREASSDPENQRNLFSMRTYTICLPLRNEGFGAIVSAKTE